MLKKNLIKLCSIGSFVVVPITTLLLSYRQLLLQYMRKPTAADQYNGGGKFVMSQRYFLEQMYGDCKGERGKLFGQTP